MRLCVHIECDVELYVGTLILVCELTGCTSKSASQPLYIVTIRMDSDRADPPLCSDSMYGLRSAVGLYPQRVSHISVNSQVLHNR